jgi:hypothetical protein
MDGGAFDQMVAPDSGEQKWPGDRAADSAWVVLYSEFTEMLWADAGGFWVAPAAADCDGGIRFGHGEGDVANGLSFFNWSMRTIWHCAAQNCMRRWSRVLRSSIGADWRRVRRRLWYCRFGNKPYFQLAGFMTKVTNYISQIQADG